MTNVEMIENLTRQMPDFNPEYLKIGGKYLLEMLNILSKNNINYDEVSIIGLGSHVFSLVKRIKEHEEMVDLGTDILSQIDKSNYELAIELGNVVQQAENIKLVDSEILLLSIHIQNLKEN